MSNLDTIPKVPSQHKVIPLKCGMVITTVYLHST